MILEFKILAGKCIKNHEPYSLITVNILNGANGLNFWNHLLFFVLFAGNYLLFCDAHQPMASFMEIYNISDRIVPSRPSFICQESGFGFLLDSFMFAYST